MRDSEQDLVFRQRSDDIGLHDIDQQEKKTKANQRILKEHLISEKLNVDPSHPDYERLRNEFEERENIRTQEAINKLPIKQKRKWRLW